MKPLCILIIILFCNCSLHARQPKHRKHRTRELGIKLGGSFDKMTGPGWSTPYQGGYFGGIYAGLHGHFFGLQAEALIRSALYSPVRNVYLSVPVLFEARLMPMVWMQLGPQYSYLLSSKYAGTSDATDMFNPQSVSGIIGLKIQLSRSVNIGSRYIFGLSDENTAPSPDAWKQQSIQLYAGLKLF